MRRIVLDASAVMVFFEGGRRVSKIRELVIHAAEDRLHLAMSVVNWGEVYYTTWRARGQSHAEQIAADIGRLRIELVAADTEQTKLAAWFRVRSRLPYADCFAAALAKERNASILTADRDFELVKTQLPIIWVN